MPSYAERVDYALANESPSDSVAGVKQAVTAEMVALDPGMHVEVTPYFNHSYVPDLVASWPKDPKIGKRYIYLKFNSQPTYLLEDIGLVGEHHPIVFGLGLTPRDDKPTVEQIEAVSRENNALVTDAYGVENFIADQQKALHRFDGLVASSIAQGGKGLLDGPRSESVAATLREGYRGARRTEEGATHLATQTIDAVLDETYADRLSRILQAVWVGSGGRLDQFPGRRNLTSEIPDDVLQYLFELEDISSIDYWRRLGRGVELAQLGRLEISTPNPNLDRAIFANSDQFWARACRLFHEEPRVDDNPDDETPRWVIERGMIGLRGQNFVVYLADRVEALKELPKDDLPLPGLTLDDLLARANGRTLDKLVLSADGRDLTYSSAESENLLDDPRLPALLGSLGGHASISSVVVVLGGIRHLTCDFEASVARTGNRILIGDFLDVAIPFLRRTTPKEIAAIAARFSPPYIAPDLFTQILDKAPPGVSRSEVLRALRSSYEQRALPPGPTERPDDVAATDDSDDGGG